MINFPIRSFPEFKRKKAFVGYKNDMNGNWLFLRVEEAVSSE